VSDDEKEEEGKGEMPDHLKPYGFKKGNRMAVGNKGGGRPRTTLSKTEQNDITLTKFRRYIDDRTNWPAVVNTMYINGFEKKNKDGSYGSISWAKLFLAYAIGQPPVKIESQHTNTVDLMREMIRQSAEADDRGPIVDSEVVDD